MLEQILVPLDGSQLAETVLPHAFACAQATSSALLLVHVLQTVNSERSEARAVDPLEWQLLKEERLRYIERKAEQLSHAGAKVESVLLLGEAAERIVEFAHERDVDLVIMSSHGQSGLSPWSVSSVVQKVILTTHSSVMIIPAYHSPSVPVGDLHYGRIVAPLDGSQRAEYVLPLLQLLAQKHDSEINLVTVVPRPEIFRRTPPASEDAELADKLVTRNRAESEKYLGQLESRIDGHIRSTVIVSEDVVGDLHDFVQRQKADLVIFSAHGTSGNRNRRYGSIVTSFIAYGSTPLLIIQDLPAQKIARTEAEVAAQKRTDTSGGARMVINASAAV